MHYNACYRAGLAGIAEICIFFHARPSGLLPASRAAALRLSMALQDRVGECRDRMQRRCRGLAMRRMPGVGKDRHVDRTITLLLRDLDLADGPVLIVRALDNRNRYADIGEIVGNIP